MQLATPESGMTPASPRRRRVMSAGRALGLATALVAGLFPMAAPVAAASTTGVSGGSSISADTAATGGTGAWTTLTGPVITESGAGQVGAGTIVLTLPSGFELDTASGAVALSGTTCAGLSLTPLSLSSTTAAATISGASSGACTLTWSGLRVRPTAGTPKAAGTITRGGTASITGVASGTSMGTLTEVAGTAAKLVYTMQPSGGTGGTAFTSQPVVAVTDQFGNAVTSATPVISLAVTSGTGTAGATFVCTGGTTKTAVSGVATFAGCMIDKAGTGYTLDASATSLTGATSVAFAINVGAAMQAVFEVPPGGGTGGTAWATQPVVRLLDAGGNATTATTAVTLAIASGTGTTGAALTCTGGLTKTAVAGVATFAGCAVDRSGTGYQLRATGTGLTAATSSTFNVTVGPAARLVITTQPGGGTAGAAWAAQPVVAVADAGGNTVPGATDTVTLAIGVNSGSGTLSCTGGLSAAAVAGTATFAGCTIDRSGTGYTLVATAAGLTSATSSGLTVSAAAPAALVVGTQPSGGTGGVAWSGQPVVRIVDAFGNLTSSTATVTLALTPGTGTTGAVFSCAGGQGKAAVAGVATFSGCKVDLAGTGYTLAATAVGVTGATTSAFAVTVGPAAQLAFTTQPGGGTGGAAWAVQPVVEVRDAGGNPVTTSVLAVTLAITTGTGTTGAALACTPGLTVSAVAGVATFAGCRIDKAGAGYTLKASGTSVSAATSSVLAVTVGAPAKLAFGTQPGGGVAGTVWAAQPVVLVQDAGGNTVTSATTAVTIAQAAGPAGAVLSCSSTGTVAAVAGITTFAGCTLDKSGTTYTLAASAGGLTGVTSSVFTITANIPVALSVTTQPSGGTGGVGWATQPTIKTVDAYGNVASSTVTITLALTPFSGTEGATLACTGGLSKAASSGSVSFSGCAVDKAGTGYTLTVTSAGLTGTVSGAFAITVGPAAIAVFDTSPGGGTGGTAWATQPVVRLLDAGGNATTATTAVTLAIASGTGTTGAALTCTGGLTKTAVAGVATFAGCAVDRSGTGYQLRATGTGLTAATSSTFNVTVGPAARLVITTQPGGGTAGAAWAAQPVVAVADAGGNTVPGATDTVTLAIGVNSGSGTLSCTGGLSAAAVAGTATFAGCTIDRSGTGYTLVATAAGLTSATSSGLTVSAAAPAALVVGTQPSGGTGGVAWSGQPVVRIVDAFGNLTSSTATVTLALTPGTGTTGAVFSCAGGQGKAAVAGVATFSGCKVDLAGTGYTLAATAVGVTGATTSAFAVTVGPAAQLAFTTQPGGGTGGAAWAVQPVVEVRDAGGNPVTTSVLAVTLAITTGTGTTGAALACTPGLTVSAVAGVATFAGCRIDKAGAGYTLKASGTSVSAATSSVLAVTVGAPAKLAFTTTQAGITAGSPFATQPVIAVQDAGGNTVTLAATTITIAVTSGTGTSGATLTCTGGTGKDANSGVAAFTGCTVDKAGTAYTLTASAGGLTSGTSASFAVTAAPATALAFTSQPSGGTGGTVWTTQPVVRLVDAYGNAASGSATITLSVTIGTGNLAGQVTCTGGQTKATASSIATFAGCKVDKAGIGYTLSATATGFVGATSATFDVVPGPAVSMAFTVQPSGGLATVAWGTQPVVSLLDAGGNVATSAVTPVTLGLAAGSTGSLSCYGGLTKTLSAGEAAFTGCAIDRAASGVALTATATGLTTVTSTTFTINAGPAVKLGFTVQPGGGTGGTAWATQPVVSIQDAGGNTVTLGGVVITLTLTSNDAGGTFLCNGGATRTTASGVATWSGCTIDLVGTNYVVTASVAGGLYTSAASTAFNVITGPASRLVFDLAPSGGTGGSAWAVQPVVSVADAGGNPTSGSATVTLALEAGSGTPGATLLCTGGLTRAAVAGRSTFAGCSIDKSGTGYRLRASASGLTDGLSGTFPVTAGAAARLTFTVQASGGPAGSPWSVQPVVTLADAGGNLADTSTASVTLDIATNPGGGTLSCTGGTTVAAVAGIATFTGCTLDKAASGYQLLAVAAGMTSATGATFGVVAGAPAQLEFSTTPGAGTGGTAFAAQPVVRVEDVYGNLAGGTTTNVTLALAANPSGGALTCNGGLTAPSIAGLAVFSGCSVDLVGTAYTISATASGLGGATSAAFDITAGSPARLMFTLQPSGGTGGSAWAVQPVIAVRDAGGNPTGATVPVTLSLGANPGSGSLVCTTGLVRTTVNGTVAFGGCEIDRAASGYTILATASGLTAATSSAFAITVGDPAQLGFAVQPSGGAAGSLWSVQPVVAVEDAGGNTVPGATALVALAPGPGAAGALACAGGTSIAAVNGAASFSGCSWNLIGSGNVVQAISTGLAPATSAPFTVTVGTPAKLAFTTTPSGATGGTAFTTQPSVQVTDAFDNAVTISSTAITLSLQANIAGGALACNGGPIRTTNAGLASFTGCSIDKAGSAYRVVASAPGLLDAVSPPFDVVPGAATQLAFLVDPGSGMGGSALGTQPVVTLLDAGGNQTTAAGGAVTLALTPGSGTTGAQLACTNGNAVVPAGGLAVFAGCAVDRVGAGYTLTASRTGFASVVSATFSVTVGPASSLVITTGTGGGTGGVAWAVQPVVTIVDAGGNPTTSTAVVTLALASNPTGGVLACSGGASLAAAAGNATFAGCLVDMAGVGYTLRATSPGLGAATGAPFAVVAGPAARVGFAATPAGGPADAAFAVQPQVVLYDAGGNQAASTVSVTLTISTGTGASGATLTCPGGTTRSADNGLVTFDGCAIDRAGTGFRLVASGPGLAPATSTAFDITAPTAVLTLGVSSPVITYRETLALTATFAKLGAARPVAFEFSTNGTTWVAMATVISNADGVARYSLQPSLNRAYRAVFLGDATLAPGTSPSVTVFVRQVVTLTPATSTSGTATRVGRSVTFLATVRPWNAGRPRAVVTFTVWKWTTTSGWVAIARRSVQADLLAQAAFRYTFSRTGRYSITARAGATTVVLASLSSTRSVWRVS